MALVSTQKLAQYSTCNREKLTLPQDVVEKIPTVFPPELRSARRAELIMFLEGPNEGRPFVVTASLQKLRTNGENGVRVVLLESGWKPVARKLGLKRGDTVSIFLLDNMAWTYLIQVERAPRRMDFNLNVPAQPDMEINLNQPNQLVRVDFDLNEPAYLNMEINLNNEE